MNESLELFIYWLLGPVLMGFAFRYIGKGMEKLADRQKNPAWEKWLRSQARGLGKVAPVACFSIGAIGAFAVLCVVILDQAGALGN